MRRVVSVSELTAALRDLVESRFQEIWVEGELSGARVWNTGHLYFTLKDARAQVKGVMFRSALRLLRFKPEDGVHVVARGRLSVYDPRGEYQLVCEHMEPKGLGALQLAYEQLRDPARRRGPLRRRAQAAAAGAAPPHRRRHLARRRGAARHHPRAAPPLSRTRTSSSRRPASRARRASRDIARALRQVARIDGVDVVIVGRGGGSIEDLWAFNEEAVARAIAASPVPVISAVGHETDVTIADFVADLRAPTPSAAAELVVRRKDEFTGHIDALTRRVGSALRARLQRLDGRLHQLQARPAFAGVPARVALRHRHVAELTASLRRGTARRGRRSPPPRRGADAGADGPSPAAAAGARPSAR